MKAVAQIIIVLFFLSVNQVFGQDSAKEDANLLKLYAGTDKETGAAGTDSTVWLLKAKPYKADVFKKRMGANSRRQISKDWFVVLKEALLSPDSSLVDAYYPASYNWKLSPSLLIQRYTLPKNKPFDFLVQTEDNTFAIPHLQQLPASVRIVKDYNKKIVQLKTTLSFLLDSIIKNPKVVFADIKNAPPKEEMVINDYDNSVNAINLFFSKYPLVNGAGLSVSVKENRFDTADIDFKNRYLPTNNSSLTITTHATTMATLIGGGGNSFHTGKGIAPGATLSSSSFANLLPDSDSSYKAYKTSVQNHSYGTRVENFYGAEAAAFDEAALNNPKLVYIFSAGNSGSLTDSSGPYQNAARFANLTGNFKQAKNIITVGSVDSFYRIPAASSKGPAYDGRIKPELVAYGNDGSSGAAAITSGTATAIQAAYAMQHHDSLPDNALVKAILINSADDVFNEGPDYYSGYGNVNTWRAVRDVNSNQFFYGSAKENSIDSFTISVPDSVKNIRITLVWKDAPAQPNAFTALVNDLDISSKQDNSNTTWLPWVLNTLPDSALLLSAPQRGRDSLNVVEQVTISQPAKGDYKIYVKGYNIASASQPFYVVYEMDTLNRFTFISPSADDHVSAGGKSIIRWKNSYNNTAGKLEYSVDKGLSWQLINNAVLLADGYYQWQAPDTNALGLVRVRLGNIIYTSDTFDFCRQLQPQVVVDCNDSVLIKWNGLKGIGHYEVSALGDQYLQPYAIVNDTAITIKNSTSPYIAIAPLFDNGRRGLESYTFDFNKQGAGCYINNFLANLTPDDKARLLLTLGTTRDVDSVQFQQLNRSHWQTLSTVAPVITNELQYIASLVRGNNIFRAVAWVKGDSIASNPASVLYFKTSDFIAKPNPLRQGQNLSLLSSTLQTGILVVYDMLGRRLLQQEVNNAQNIIATNTLAKGLYLLVIYDDKQVLFKNKLLIE